MHLLNLNENELIDILNNKLSGCTKLIDSYYAILKLGKYSEGYLKVSRGKYIIRYNIFISHGQKVFTLYYDIKSDLLFARNQLNYLKKLRTSSVRKEILTLDDLERVLKEMEENFNEN